MLHHLTTTTSIYQAGLSEVGDFSSILDNGDQALHLKQPLRFIYNIVKSTMQAIYLAIKHVTCSKKLNLIKNHKPMALIQHSSLSGASVS